MELEEALKSTGIIIDKDSIPQLELLMKAYAKQEIDKVVNSPQYGNFVKAVKSEMAHHNQRWGNETHKDPMQFNVVLSYILGKLSKAIFERDSKKYEHHLITLAAVCGTTHLYFKDNESAVFEWFRPF